MHGTSDWVLWLIVYWPHVLIGAAIVGVASVIAWLLWNWQL